jgi:putative oligomerization/nucleic acid binding protein
MTAAASSTPIEAPVGRSSRLSDRRRAGVWALVVLGSLAGLLAIVAIWINRQLLSDSASTQTSTALVQDATVRRALSGYLVDQLYANVDVPNELEQRLPSQLKPLAAPAAAALRDPAVQAVDFLLARPSVQALFVASATDAHRQLINVLENKTGLGVTTGNGTVQVNLGQLIRQVGTELGLPTSAVNKLPPNAGVITVMRSDQLGLAQSGVRAIRILSVWLIVLVLALFGLALYLAEGVRRQTLRNIGWAFVIVGLVVFVARRLTGDYVIGGLTTSTYEVPAQHIWVIGTSTLGEIGWATVIYGVIIVLGAGLAGPTRVATAVRRWLAPVLNERPGIAWAAVGVAYLLVVLWGATYALRTPLGIVIIGGLVAAGVYAFRRQTLREFPERTEHRDLRATASAAVDRVRQFASSREPASGWRIRHHRSAAEELAHLAELHSSGALTDEEFARAKAAVLE